MSDEDHLGDAPRQILAVYESELREIDERVSGLLDRQAKLRAAVTALRALVPIEGPEATEQMPIVAALGVGEDGVVQAEPTGPTRPDGRSQRVSYPTGMSAVRIVLDEAAGEPLTPQEVLASLVEREWPPRGGNALNATRRNLTRLEERDADVGRTGDGRFFVRTVVSSSQWPGGTEFGSRVEVHPR